MNNSSIFIDWVSIAQKHQFLDLPTVGGSVRAKAEKAEFLDVDGVKYLVLSNDKDKAALGYSLTSLQHCGSHDTKVITRCDGQMVSLSGNVGRLDRPDNVFNYGLDDTLIKASNVVQQYGLPAFSAGDCIPKATLSQHDQTFGLLVNYTGAYLRELHVTSNFFAGNEAIAKEVMRYMGGLRSARLAKGMYGDETIVFGHLARKGKRMHKALVVYRKAAEMLAHAKGDIAKKLVRKSPEYQLAHETGLIRVECKWGNDFLRDNAIRFIGEANMPKVISIFQRETDFLLNASPDRAARLVSEMPVKVRSAALHWIRGDDLRQLMSRATYFRMVKALRDYGIDASEPRHTTGQLTSEDVLQSMLDSLPKYELHPLTCPSWYGLPEVQRVAA